MQEIEAWRVNERDPSERSTEELPLEKFVEHKLRCWQEAEQQFKRDSALSVDMLAALKMHCTGTDLCGRLMEFAMCDAQLQSSRRFSDADSLAKVWPCFKPYLWQLQSVLQGQPAYSDDQLVYCEPRGKPCKTSHSTARQRGCVANSSNCHPVHEGSPFKLTFTSNSAHLQGEAHPVAGARHLTALQFPSRCDGDCGATSSWLRLSL
mmetsp:Transcript_9307/g.20836  ORF Transcript_9307/g.20836 Transcript_9307/m.20836 type:complete len:207 (-) Transcript_9307:565-1185(-)